MPTINTRSVRFRTTAGAALALLALLTISGIVVILLVAREVRQAADSSLIERAEDRAILLGGGNPADALTQVVGDEVVVAVFGPDGAVLASSGTPDPTELFPLPEGVSAIELIVEEEEHPGDEAESPHREDVRAAARTLDDGRRVVVAGEEEQTNQTVAAVSAVLIIASLVTAATASLVAWIVTGRALAPVGRIRRDLDAVVTARGRSRVTEPDSGDEVAALATTLNDVLGQLESQSAARRRFVADASHELKSPVANARALIETGEPSAELDHRVIGELDRLQSLVDDLLYLAGTDERAPTPPTVLVDLDDLAFDEAERVTARTTNRIDASGVQPAAVLGDRSGLARACRNLVENAVRHADSTVSIAIVDRDDHWVLVVADDGPGIPAHARERIFERFTRLADDRSRADGGTGLGLSIVAAVAEHHGGTIAVVDPPERPDTTPSSGARFELALPKPA